MVKIMDIQTNPDQWITALVVAYPNRQCVFADDSVAERAEHLQRLLHAED